MFASAELAPKIAYPQAVRGSHRSTPNTLLFELHRGVRDRTASEIQDVTHVHAGCVRRSRVARYSVLYRAVAGVGVILWVGEEKQDRRMGLQDMCTRTEAADAQRLGEPEVQSIEAGEDSHCDGA